MATTATGGKGRKFGRTKSKPCQMRYTIERRWIKNKKKKDGKALKTFSK